jgi:hypothetical protein
VNKYNLIMIKDRKMKNLLIFGLLSLLFLLGCDQELDLTSQTTPLNPPSSGKQWITLSDNSGISIENAFYISWYNVDGKKGWNNTFDYTYPSGIRTYGDLDCPKNAYEGKMTIALKLDDLISTSDFTPSPFTFNIPLEYTITYEGLDLIGINPAKVDFYYIAPDGSMVKAVYDNLQVDISNGRLSVLNARLPHFSRYGFVN